MVIKIVPHLSPGYWDTVALRDQVLREPLHLVFTEEELLAEGDQIHLAAYSKEDELLACLVLVPLSATEVKMRQVAVHPKFQGRGVGHFIVEKSEILARRKGFEKMVLHAREVASKFYLKEGYQMDGKPFEEVGLPHFRMVKNLSK